MYSREVCLVIHGYHRFIPHADIGEDLHDDLLVFLTEGRRKIDDVYDQVGLVDALECCLESIDELGGKIPYESHRVYDKASFSI